MSNIVIFNLVNEALEGNYAEFGNEESEDENLGECTWDTPIFNSSTGKYEVHNVEGLDVTGTPFDEGTLTDIPEADTVNPTKVFWWIVKKIKGVLCPNCM